MSMCGPILGPFALRVELAKVAGSLLVIVLDWELVMSLSETVSVVIEAGIAEKNRQADALRADRTGIVRIIEGLQESIDGHQGSINEINEQINDIKAEIRDCELHLSQAAKRNYYSVAQLKDMAEQTGKLHAVKAFKDMTGMALMDAKHTIEAMAIVSNWTFAQ
jgi:ribosomal protein L7/L12